jgi:hypothetical protein
LKYEDVRAGLPEAERPAFESDMARHRLVLDVDDDPESGFLAAWEGWRETARVPDGVLVNQQILRELLPADTRSAFDESMRLWTAPAGLSASLATATISPQAIDAWEYWRRRARRGSVMTLAQVRDALPTQLREDFQRDIHSAGINSALIAAWERYRALAVPQLPLDVVASAARILNFLEQRAAQSGVDVELLYTVHSHLHRDPADLLMSDLATLVRFCGHPEGPLPIVVKHLEPYRERWTCAGRPYIVQRVRFAQPQQDGADTGYAIYDLGDGPELDPEQPTATAGTLPEAQKLVRAHRAAHGGTPYVKAGD